LLKGNIGAAGSSVVKIGKIIIAPTGAENILSSWTNPSASCAIDETEEDVRFLDAFFLPTLLSPNCSFFHFGWGCWYCRGESDQSSLISNNKTAHDKPGLNNATDTCAAGAGDGEKDGATSASDSGEDDEEDGGDRASGAELVLDAERCGASKPASTEVPEMPGREPVGRAPANIVRGEAAESASATEFEAEKRPRSGAEERKASFSFKNETNACMCPPSEAAALASPLFNSCASNAASAMLFTPARWP
jgi:hypothetical protein